MGTESTLPQAPSLARAVPHAEPPAHSQASSTPTTPNGWTMAPSQASSSLMPTATGDGSRLPHGAPKMAQSERNEDSDEQLLQHNALPNATILYYTGRGGVAENRDHGRWTTAEAQSKAPTAPASTDAPSAAPLPPAASEGLKRSLAQLADSVRRAVGEPMDEGCVGEEGASTLQEVRNDASTALLLAHQGAGGENRHAMGEGSFSALKESMAQLGLMYQRGCITRAVYNTRRAELVDEYCGIPLDADDDEAGAAGPVQPVEETATSGTIQYVFAGNAPSKELQHNATAREKKKKEKKSKRGKEAKGMRRTEVMRSSPAPTAPSASSSSAVPTAPEHGPRLSHGAPTLAQTVSEQGTTAASCTGPPPEATAVHGSQLPPTAASANAATYQCPFDERHKLRAEEVASHVAQCRPVDAKRFYLCPFDRGHRIPAGTVPGHVRRCPSRPSLKAPRAPPPKSASSSSLVPTANEHASRPSHGAPTIAQVNQEQDGDEKPPHSALSIDASCTPPGGVGETRDRTPAEAQSRALTGPAHDTRSKAPGPNVYQCPFDERHKLRAEEVASHLEHCRPDQSRPATALYSCPFAPWAHHMPARTIPGHVLRCPNRPQVRKRQPQATLATLAALARAGTVIADDAFYKQCASCRYWNLKVRPTCQQCGVALPHQLSGHATPAPDASPLKAASSSASVTPVTEYPRFQDLDSVIAVKSEVAEYPSSHDLDSDIAEYPHFYDLDSDIKVKSEAAEYPHFYDLDSDIKVKSEVAEYPHFYDLDSDIEVKSEVAEYPHFYDLDSDIKVKSEVAEYPHFYDLDSDIEVKSEVAEYPHFYDLDSDIEVKSEVADSPLHSARDSPDSPDFFADWAPDWEAEVPALLPRHTAHSEADGSPHRHGVPDEDDETLLHELQGQLGGAPPERVRVRTRRAAKCPRESVAGSLSGTGKVYYAGLCRNERAVASAKGPQAPAATALHAPWAASARSTAGPRPRKRPRNHVQATPAQGRHRPRTNEAPGSDNRVSASGGPAPQPASRHSLIVSTFPGCDPNSHCPGAIVVEQVERGRVTGALYVFRMRPAAAEDEAVLLQHITDLTVFLRKDFIRKRDIYQRLTFQEAKKHARDPAKYQGLLDKLEARGSLQSEGTVFDFLGFVCRVYHHPLHRETVKRVERVLRDLDRHHRPSRARSSCLENVEADDDSDHAIPRPKKRRRLPRNEAANSDTTSSPRRPGLAGSEDDVGGLGTASPPAAVTERWRPQVPDSTSLDGCYSFAEVKSEVTEYSLVGSEYNFGGLRHRPDAENIASDDDSDHTISRPKKRCALPCDEEANSDTTSPPRRPGLAVSEDNVGGVRHSDEDVEVDVTIWIDVSSLEAEAEDNDVPEDENGGGGGGGDHHLHHQSEDPDAEGNVEYELCADLARRVGLGLRPTPPPPKPAPAPAPKPHAQKARSKTGNVFVPVPVDQAAGVLHSGLAVDM